MHDGAVVLLSEKLCDGIEGCVGVLAAEVHDDLPGFHALGALLSRCHHGVADIILLADRVRDHLRGDGSGLFGIDDVL